MLWFAMGQLRGLRRRIPIFARWQVLVYLSCASFGILLVALIHTLGDGGWFWYSVMMRSGSHLYSDLHLPLQPLFPLELHAFQLVFGTRWLPSQMLGIFNVL